MNSKVQSTGKHVGQIHHQTPAMITWNISNNCVDSYR